MARMKPDLLEEFLQRPLNAVLSSLRRDGRPYQVPVWFLWSDGVFWLTGTYGRAWCLHLMHDPRSSLCIQASDPISRYVTIDTLGEAYEPQDHDIWPVSRRLAEKYVGARGGNVDAFMQHMVEEERLLFRLVPQRWQAIDLTVYVGSRRDVATQRSRRSMDGG